MITPFQQLCTAYLTHLRTLGRVRLQRTNYPYGRPDFMVAVNHLPIGYIKA